MVNAGYAGESAEDVNLRNQDSDGPIRRFRAHLVKTGDVYSTGGLMRPASVAVIFAVWFNGSQVMAAEPEDTLGDATAIVKARIGNAIPNAESCDIWAVRMTRSTIGSDVQAGIYDPQRFRAQVIGPGGVLRSAPPGEYSLFKGNQLITSVEVPNTPNLEDHHLQLVQGMWFACEVRRMCACMSFGKSTLTSFQQRVNDKIEGLDVVIANTVTNAMKNLPADLLGEDQKRAISEVIANAVSEPTLRTKILEAVTEALKSQKTAAEKTLIAALADSAEFKRVVRLAVEDALKKTKAPGK
jgi:hypothetical protein